MYLHNQNHIKLIITTKNHLVSTYVSKYHVFLDCQQFIFSCQFFLQPISMDRQFTDLGFSTNDLFLQQLCFT